MGKLAQILPFSSKRSIITPKIIEEKSTNTTLGIRLENLRSVSSPNIGHETNQVANTLVNKIDRTEKEHFRKSKQIISFWEFLEEVVKNPKLLLRNSSQYAVDMMDYWNKAVGVSDDRRITVLGQEVKPLAWITSPWLKDRPNDYIDVFGQEIVINDLYNLFIVNAQKIHPETMYLLHGPNATGKSLILERFFDALEHYSQVDEGVIYTFKWVFKAADIDDDEYGSYDTVLPVYKTFKTSTKEKMIDPDDIGFSMPADLNTNPIFLLSKEYRKELLDLLEEQGKLPENFNKDFILNGTLDSTSQKWLDVLTKEYEGDMKKLFSHIHVVRMTLSKQNRRGLVVIKPEAGHGAQLIPITPERDWNALPLRIIERISQEGIHELDGPFAKGNRGHIVFEDMWKEGNPHRYLFLLETAEKGRITIQSHEGSKGVDEMFDGWIWGLANDADIIRLHNDYDQWESMKQRISFLTIGYVRSYRSASKIYENQLKELISEETKRHISPHTLENFALWTTLTYLIPPSNEKYYDSLDIDPESKKILKSAAMKLVGANLLRKALLYQGEDIESFELDPTKQTFSPQEKVILRRHVKEISDEYSLGVGKNNFLFYEGAQGVAPRYGTGARQILVDAVKSRTKECFTIIEVLETLQEWEKDGFDYETKKKAFIEAYNLSIDQLRKISSQSINLPKAPVFPIATSLIEQVKGHSQRQIRFDVQNCLGYIKTNEQYLNSLKKYIKHVIAYISKENIEKPWRDPTNSNAPNEKFMRSIEKVLNPLKLSDEQTSTGRDEFRNKVLNILGIWQGKNEGVNSFENLEFIFPDAINSLKSKDIQENKEKLFEFLNDLYAYYEKKGITIPATQHLHNPDDSSKVEHTLILDKTREESYEPTLLALTDERRERLRTGLSALKQAGYCDRCIPRLILHFAFDDKFKSELAASIKK